MTPARREELRRLALDARLTVAEVHEVFNALRAATQPDPVGAFEKRNRLEVYEEALRWVLGDTDYLDGHTVRLGSPKWRNRLRDYVGIEP